MLPTVFISHLLSDFVSFYMWLNYFKYLHYLILFFYCYVFPLHCIGCFSLLSLKTWLKTHLLAKNATQGNRKSCVSTNTFWTKRLGLQLCCNTEETKRKHRLTACIYNLISHQDPIPAAHKNHTKKYTHINTRGTFSYPNKVNVHVFDAD